MSTKTISKTDRKRAIQARIDRLDQKIYEAGEDQYRIRELRAEQDAAWDALAALSAGY